MIKIAINGLGRIGKCVLLQLINNPNFSICCINAPNLTTEDVKDYLLYDSTHNYSKNFRIEIISQDSIKINNDIIKLFFDRNAKKLPWRDYGAEYLIDATGCYLTTEKCKDHDIDHVIMSSPPKDKNTPTFIFGVNHLNYRGEKIVSASSCTTNCIAPMLKLLNDNYTILDANFTTIHATTGSQYTVDVLNKASRTNRSILNNIIPHTTGASSAITCVLPELEGKINGTSIRIPVLNCSLLDVNVELNDKNVTLNDISNKIKHHELFDIVYHVNDKQLVSCDFLTTTTPTILDTKASISMNNGKFKLMLWYDNEWSYSAQMIRMVEHMYKHNQNNNRKIKIVNSLSDKYYYENMNIEDKKIVLRLDLNVPVNKGIITDEHRISSAVPTIKKIMSEHPSYIILASHFGRPVGFEYKYSLEFMVPVLEKYLDTKVVFLKNGISKNTLQEIEFTMMNSKTGNSDINLGKPIIFLLENLRFYDEETRYETMSEIDKNNNEIIQLYRKLGNLYISDAFGCLHRKHMSICDMKYSGNTYAYGGLIKKEIDEINDLLHCNGKILGIIGGNKIKDKMPLIDALKKIPNSTLFIAGGLAKQYNETHANVFVMNDGYGNLTLNDTPKYICDKKNIENFYDIGIHSLSVLFKQIEHADVIFWNGSLGVIEHEIYKNGSTQLVQYLESLKNKKIIIGGGETASLFTNHHSHIYVSTGGGALLEYLHDKVIFNKFIPGLDIFVETY
jgi:glyceraldehyde 3-phosphate dehydrogenase